MAYSRYKHFDTVNNAELVHKQKGFQTSNLEELFTSDDDPSYRIPLKHRFRPDLIAQHFYRNPRLFFVLVYANNFRRCPEDFTERRVIKVPRYERVISLL